LSGWSTLGSPLLLAVAAGGWLLAGRKRISGAKIEAGGYGGIWARTVGDLVVREYGPAALKPLKPKWS